MCIGRPVWLSNDEFNVFEEKTPLVADIAVDVEGQGSYDIAGGEDGDLFEINPSTGLLRFKDGAPDFENPLDADGDNLYEVSVRFTDFSGASVTRLVRVTVEDDPSDNGGGNAPPQFTNIPDDDKLYLDENTTFVEMIQATDPEGGSITYSIKD
ncbi:MAG: cadherin repeat domain-containing protein [Cyanobacteria bacterium P01_F01_bin.150]